MTLEVLATFVVASSLISLSPGPDNIFVLTQSALYGRKSGIVITLGLCTGLIFHTVIVAAGLAVVFQTSPLAFNLLKFVGAAYLIFLAYKAVTAKPAALSSESDTGLSFKALYARGIIMNVTNPKVSIFFLAFLPQFTQPETGNLMGQFVVLGVIFMAVALVIFSLIAYLSGVLGHWIASSDQRQLYLNRVAGTVFVLLAVRLLFSSASA